MNDTPVDDSSQLIPTQRIGPLFPPRGMVRAIPGVPDLTLLLTALLRCLSPKTSGDQSRWDREHRSYFQPTAPAIRSQGEKGDPAQRLRAGPLLCTQNSRWPCGQKVSRITPRYKVLNLPRAKEALHKKIALRGLNKKPSQNQNGAAERYCSAVWIL